MSSPEELKGSQENNVEIQNKAGERLEALANDQERKPEKSIDVEKSAESAKIEALEAAVSVEAGGAEKKRGGEPSGPAPRGPIGKKQKEVSYKRTMKQVQTEMTPASRTFSKFIHNKAVEKTSDALGSTIARPNAILAGAVFAFVLTLAVYVVAKTYGYVLSGFETIGAFILGWVVGIIYDYLRVLVTGKKT